MTSPVIPNVPLMAGSMAPDFTLPDETDRPIQLSQFRGRKVILYFYPKDDTPGCTLEACNFQDEMAEFRQRNAVVVGVSTDSVASHKLFREKYRLEFPLLSDADRVVVKQYGVWREKTIFSRLFKGTERSTFLIDEKGVILKIFPKVQVTGHLEEILAVLDGKAL